MAIRTADSIQIILILHLPRILHTFLCCHIDNSLLSISSAAEPFYTLL